MILQYYAYGHAQQWTRSRASQAMPDAPVISDPTSGRYGQGRLWLGLRPRPRLRLHQIARFGARR